MSDLKVEEIRLPGDVFPIRAGEGYVVIPVREGLLIPTDSGVTFRQRFGTYDYQGCHMAMAGCTPPSISAAASWRPTLDTSAVLRKSARGIRLRVLGKGDYVTIAKAYREVTHERRYLVTWDRKLAGHPERAGYLGASNVKLWSALQRRMNEESTAEESVRVNWTFEEAAQLAEHLKRNLQLDKVLFGLGGWIHRGYDNQHPDVLPAAPEPGGNEGLADCARRVEGAGYLLAPHDNYQDIYLSRFPSWDEKWTEKKVDGRRCKAAVGPAVARSSPVRGRRWSPRAVRRTLTAVRDLTHGHSYFIDATYTASLSERFDPLHPLTKLDDMRWKQELSDYARGVFGSFGSESGREWAIPYADYFEGLTGVSGTYFHNTGSDLLKDTGGAVVPSFELVYRDTIAMYGKYGYDIRHAAEYELFHIAIRRPLNYHPMPSQTYWTTPAGAPTPPTAGPDPAPFVRGDNGWTEDLHPADRFLKNTHVVLSPLLNGLTARVPMMSHEFLDTARQVRHTVFGKGAQRVDLVVNIGSSPFRWRSELGGEVDLPPYGFVVEGQQFVAFHARNWNGQSYSSPPLLTLRSQDRRALATSRRVHAFHGFGDSTLRFGGGRRTVHRDEVLTR